MKTIEGTRLRVADDISQLVGETPVLQLKKLVPADSADIFVKLEYLNPGGSVKDRAAIGIIRRAEQEGTAAPRGHHRRSHRRQHRHRPRPDRGEPRLQSRPLRPRAILRRESHDHASPRRPGDPHTRRRGHGREPSSGPRNLPPAIPTPSWRRNSKTPPTPITTTKPPPRKSSNRWKAASMPSPSAPELRVRSPVSLAC